MAASGGEEPADHPVESLELLLRIRANNWNVEGSGRSYNAERPLSTSLSIASDSNASSYSSSSFGPLSSLSSFEGHPPPIQAQEGRHFLNSDYYRRSESPFSESSWQQIDPSLPLTPLRQEVVRSRNHSFASSASSFILTTGNTLRRKASMGRLLDRGSKFEEEGRCGLGGLDLEAGEIGIASSRRKGSSEGATKNMDTLRGSGGATVLQRTTTREGKQRRRRPDVLNFNFDTTILTPRPSPSSYTSPIALTPTTARPTFATPLPPMSSVRKRAQTSFFSLLRFGKSTPAVPPPQPLPHSTLPPTPTSATSKKAGGGGGSFFSRAKRTEKISAKERATTSSLQYAAQVLLDSRTIERVDHTRSTSQTSGISCESSRSFSMDRGGLGPAFSPSLSHSPTTTSSPVRMTRPNRPKSLRNANALSPSPRKRRAQPSSIIPATQNQAPSPVKTIATSRRLPAGVFEPVRHSWIDAAASERESAEERVSLRSSMIGMREEETSSGEA